MMKVTCMILIEGNSPKVVCEISDFVCKTFICPTIITATKLVYIYYSDK